MYYKKSKAKIGGKTKWFIRSVVIGEPVDTQELGEAIGKVCTASPADVHAVIRALPEVMAGFMDSGRSVHMDGLGSFFYKLSCAGRGADSPEEAGPDQVEAIRVQFIPERRKGADGYGRALVRNASLIELGGPETGTGAEEEAGE